MRLISIVRACMMVKMVTMVTMVMMLMMMMRMISIFRACTPGVDGDDGDNGDHDDEDEDDDEYEDDFYCQSLYTWSGFHQLDRCPAIAVSNHHHHHHQPQHHCQPPNPYQLHHHHQSDPHCQSSLRDSDFLTLVSRLGLVDLIILPILLRRIVNCVLTQKRSSES